MKCHYCLIKLGESYILCSECPTTRLCFKCFAYGVEGGKHKKTHNYIIENSVSKGDTVLFSESNSWEAEEELKLLNAVETYGYGNWNEVSIHLGKRDVSSCREHYERFYRNGIIGLNGTQQPASFVNDHTENETKSESKDVIAPDLRIEEQRLMGYLPNRDEFEYEYMNEAEEILNAIHYETSCDDLKHSLQVTLIDIYNRFLEQRQFRHDVARTHQLLSLLMRDSLDSRTVRLPTTTKKPMKYHTKRRFGPFSKRAHIIMGQRAQSKHLSAIRASESTQHGLDNHVSPTHTTDNDPNTLGPIEPNDNEVFVHPSLSPSRFDPKSLHGPSDVVFNQLMTRLAAVMTGPTPNPNTISHDAKSSKLAHSDCCSKSLFDLADRDTKSSDLAADIGHTTTTTAAAVNTTTATTNTTTLPQPPIQTTTCSQRYDTSSTSSETMDSGISCADSSANSTVSTTDQPGTTGIQSVDLVQAESDLPKPQTRFRSNSDCSYDRDLSYASPTKRIKIERVESDPNSNGQQSSPLSCHSDTPQPDQLHQLGRGNADDSALISPTPSLNRQNKNTGSSRTKITQATKFGKRGPGRPRKSTNPVQTPLIREIPKPKNEIKHPTWLKPFFRFLTRSEAQNLLRDLEHERILRKELYQLLSQKLDSSMHHDLFTLVNPNLLDPTSNLEPNHPTGQLGSLPKLKQRTTWPALGHKTMTSESIPTRTSKLQQLQCPKPLKFTKKQQQQQTNGNMNENKKKKQNVKITKPQQTQTVQPKLGRKCFGTIKRCYTKMLSTKSKRTYTKRLVGR